MKYKAGGLHNINNQGLKEIIDYITEQLAYVVKLCLKLLLNTESKIGRPTSLIANIAK